MSEPFLGEIRIFAGNFAPRNWALCNGQLLPIAQHTALFSIVGTFYGGDGETNFGLPNLQGRTPMHPGAGPGLTQRFIGQTGGSETETLSVAQMPPHTHVLRGTNEPANSTAGGDRVLGGADENVYGQRGTEVSMSANGLGLAGGSQPHNNRQPYLVLNFIIALTGLFPPHN